MPRHFIGQPGLADAGFAGDQKKSSLTGTRLLQTIIQFGKFTLAADERAVATFFGPFRWHYCSPPLTRAGHSTLCLALEIVSIFCIAPTSLTRASWPVCARLYRAIEAVKEARHGSPQTAAVCR